VTALEDAIARVTRLGAPAKAPVVSADDLAAIVASKAIRDAAGLVPSAPAWTPTYDTNAAIAEVYDMKAAQVAADFNFKADDASFDKGDVLANLLSLRDRYAAMAVTFGGSSVTGASTLSVGGTNAGLVNPLDAIARNVIP
jgi:hypothetical protein